MPAVPAPGGDAHARDELRALLGWLAEGCPDAFAVPGLRRRLWLYQLAYTLRYLLINPPDRRYADLPAHHPLRTLHRLVAGPDLLDDLVPAATPGSHRREVDG